MSIKNKFGVGDIVAIDYSSYPQLAQRGNEGFSGEVKSYESRTRKPYSPMFSVEGESYYYEVESEDGDKELVNESYLKLIDTSEKKEGI